MDRSHQRSPRRKIPHLYYQHNLLYLERKRKWELVGAVKMMAEGQRVVEGVEEVKHVPEEPAMRRAATF